MTVNVEHADGLVGTQVMGYRAQAFQGDRVFAKGVSDIGKTMTQARE